MKKNKTESLTDVLIKNSINSSIATLINRGGAILFTLIIARFLLPERFGIYNLAISITFIALTFCDLGINSAVIKYVSNSLSKNNIKEASAYYHYLLKIRVYLVILFSFLMIVSAYPLAYFIFKKPSLALPLIFSAFYLILLGLDAIYSSLFFAFNKVQYISYKEIIFQISRLVLIASLIFFFREVYYVSGTIFILFLSTLIPLLIAFLWIKKISPNLLIKSEVKINKKKLLKFLFYLVIGSLSVIFFANIDSIMLGIFITDASYVGFYKAAFALVLSISGFLSFGSVLLPIFPKVLKNKLNVSFNRVLKYISILAFPSAFGLIILGKYFIRTIYGYEYLPAAIPLYILSFVIVESAITTSYSALLTAKGKPELYAKSLVYATLLNVLLNFIFIYSLLHISSLWATAGAAFATLLSRFFYLFGISYVSKKKVKLKINLSNILKPLFASLIMALILFLVMLNIKDMTLLCGSLLILLGALVYSFILFLIKGITKEDFNLFKNLFRFFHS